MTRTIFIAFSAFALLVSNANAGTAALTDRCFARAYDDAHLQKHPGQEVTRTTAYFMEFEDDVAARLSFVTRPGGHLFLVSGECTEENDGALACHVCGDDASCEWTDETFGIKATGNDRITIINDMTGITAEDFGDDGSKTGKPHKFTAGGENAAFALSEAPVTQCGQ